MRWRQGCAPDPAGGAYSTPPCPTGLLLGEGNGKAGEMKGKGGGKEEGKGRKQVDACVKRM